MLPRLLYFLLLPLTLLAHTAHDGDYYVAGGALQIPDEVNGDVYAFGSQVVIDGVVNGNVYAGGGNLAVNGTVHGSLRAFAGQVDINGTIDKNILVAAGNLQFGRQSVIHGSASISAGVVNLSGTIGGDLNVRASQLELNAQVGKNVEATVATIHIGPTTSIQGSLEYTSSEPALIDQGAQINGGVTYHTSKARDVLLGEWKKKVVVASRFLSFAMNFLFSFVIGWILLRFFPEKVRQVSYILSTKLLKSTLMGLLTVLLFPLIALLLLITIVGFPMGLALFAISILTFYTAKVLSIIWLSNKLFKKIKSPMLTFTIGLFIYFLIRPVPTLGAITTSLFTLWGIGGVVISKKRVK